MATVEGHLVSRSVDTDTDIPAERSYETAADAELDRQLCAAIDAAEAADNEWLADLLRLQVGSHYYETR